MLSKISKKQSETKSLTKFKIRLKVQLCFWLLRRLFTATTSFQQTLTTLSLHNQISPSTPISLQHLKSLLPPKITIFCYFNVKIHEKQILLIIKLQPLSYQFTSNITRLPLHASQPTLLRYSHIPNAQKKTSHTPSTSTLKYTLKQRLVLLVLER